MTNHTRDRYLVNSVIEEAITSSPLERAPTTHKVAKDMFREGRKPRDVSETVIANNDDAINSYAQLRTNLLLHFMIGYIHPLVDGNGRSARALFYWAMAETGIGSWSTFPSLDDFK